MTKDKLFEKAVQYQKRQSLLYELAKDCGLDMYELNHNPLLYNIIEFYLQGDITLVKLVGEIITNLIKENKCLSGLLYDNLNVSTKTVCVIEKDNEKVEYESK